MNRRPITFCALALTALVVAACTGTGSPTPEASGPSAPSLAPPTGSPVEATPAAVQHAQPGPCPVPAGQPALPPLAEVPGTAAGVISYLNGGGGLEALLLALEAEAWLPPREQGVAQIDLTGDGWQDLALAVLDPTAATVTPPGTLYLLVCSGQGYQLSYATPPDPQIGGPLLQSVADLTGDSIPELLISRGVCGAHTCSERYQILRWQGAGFEDSLEGPTDDLPTPRLTIEGPTEAGSSRASVTAGGIASAGAGPFRPVTRTWVWDPVRQVFASQGDALLPSNYRIHVLHDGDRALENGDYEEAHAQYRRVIIDETLDDWVAGADGLANLGAFAMYRTVLTYLLEHDFGDARVAYGILQNSFPGEAAGSAYARMARAFWEAFEPLEDLAVGCLAAEAYASSHAGEILDPLYYGYANRVYSASDMCPPLP